MLRLHTALLTIVALVSARPQAPIADVTLAVPGPINITQVTTNGPGCGQNQARLEDGKILLGPLTKFEAVFQDQPRRQTSCLVMAAVTYPVGYQFTVLSGAISGTAALDAGVTARFLYAHHYQQEAQLAHNYAQEIPSGPFTISAEALHSQTIWSHCGGNDIVSVNFRIALGGDTQSGANGDVKAFTDGPFPITLSWRQCTS